MGVKKQEAPTETKDPELPPPILSFLNTVIVKITHEGRHTQAQAVLDSGSGISLISEKLASQLRLSYPQSVRYNGVHGEGCSRAYIHTELKSLVDPDKSTVITFSVILRLKPVSPPQRKKTKDSAIKELKLADHLGGAVNLIIGNLD